MQKHILTSTIAGAVGGAFIAAIILGNPGIAKKDVDRTIPQPATPVSDDNHQNSVIAAVKKANPAVVSIVITKDVPVIERYYQQAPGNQSDPFGAMFGNNFFQPFSMPMPQYRQNGTQKQEIGGGSGFLISADGLLITNRHVVAQTDAEYTVFTNDGKKYKATVKARDPVNDIAVLKIDGKNLPFLEFGNSDQLEVGQSVIAIGNALGEFRNTVSVGVISGLARSIQAGDGSGQSEQLDQVIQTDAAINPGNSGGPLLNLNGQVIGVNVAVAQGSQSVGFALPANMVKSVIDSVQKNGKIIRPFLGVRYTPITASLKEKNNLSVDYGVLVNRGETAEDLAVIPGSPADKAGIVEGDIILEADGVKLDETKSLANLVRAKQVGNAMALKILHKGQEQTVTVKLEEAPQS